MVYMPPSADGRLRTPVPTKIHVIARRAKTDVAIRVFSRLRGRTVEDAGPYNGLQMYRYSVSLRGAKRRGNLLVHPPKCTAETDMVPGDSHGPNGPRNDRKFAIFCRGGALPRPQLRTHPRLPRKRGGQETASHGSIGPGNDRKIGDPFDKLGGAWPLPVEITLLCDGVY